MRDPGANVGEELRQSANNGNVGHFLLPIRVEVVPPITAFVSVVCSYVVIREIIIDLRKGAKATSSTISLAVLRVIMMTSICDIIFAGGIGLGTLMAPSDIPYMRFNHGNIATCSAQGFLIQLGCVGAPLFSIMLSSFYYLIIKYRWTDRKFKKLEYWCYGAIWLLMIALAIMPLPLDLYNSAGPFCWIEASPFKCNDSWHYGVENATCTRGDQAWIYAIVFTVFPAWICQLVSVGIMAEIYRVVRLTERRNLRYDFSSRRELGEAKEKSSRFGIRRDSSLLFSSRSSLYANASALFAAGQVGSSSRLTAQSSASRLPSQSELYGNFSGMGSSSDLMMGQGKSTNDLMVPTAQQASQFSVAEIPMSRKEKRTKHTKDRRRSRAVARLALSYFMAFVVSNILWTFMKLMWSWRKRHNGNYWFASLCIFLPLQGFFNFLVFSNGREMRTPEGRFLRRILCFSCIFARYVASGIEDHPDKPRRRFFLNILSSFSRNSHGDAHSSGKESQDQSVLTAPQDADVASDGVRKQDSERQSIAGEILWRLPNVIEDVSQSPDSSTDTEPTEVLPTSSVDT